MKINGNWIRVHVNSLFNPSWRKFFTSEMQIKGVWNQLEGANKTNHNVISYKMKI